MQNIKTDLAIELREVADRPNDGVVSDEEMRGELKITRIQIVDENGERTLSRPRGSYITIE
ncbi:MAG: GPR endopeptidase, partial [Acutalibacteraceae bacterium]